MAVHESRTLLGNEIPGHWKIDEQYFHDGATFPDLGIIGTASLLGNQSVIVHDDGTLVAMHPDRYDEWRERRQSLE